MVKTLFVRQQITYLISLWRFVISGENS